MTTSKSKKTGGAAKASSNNNGGSKDAAQKQKPTYTGLASVGSFEQMEKIMTQGKAPFDKMSADAAKIYQENQEALAESGRIYAKHMEDITKFVTDLTQKSVEKNTEAFKSLWGCKTLQELTEAQTRLAQQNGDDLMAGATKLLELSVKLTTEAFEPINDQVSKTMQKSMAA